MQRTGVLVSWSSFLPRGGGEGDITFFKSSRETYYFIRFFGVLFLQVELNLETETEPLHFARFDFILRYEKAKSTILTKINRYVL